MPNLNWCIFELVLMKRTNIHHLLNQPSFNICNVEMLNSILLILLRKKRTHLNQSKLLKCRVRRYVFF